MSQMRTTYGPTISEARAAFVMSLFVGSLLAGVVIQRLSEPNVKENPYTQLDRVEEPVVTATVAKAILAGDARILAGQLDSQTLTSLRDALLSPAGNAIADVRSVRFVGATGKGTRIFAAYVLSGKDLSGLDVVVGFVLDVENGQIVGVN